MISSKVTVSSLLPVVLKLIKVSAKMFSLLPTSAQVEVYSELREVFNEIAVLLKTGEGVKDDAAG